MKSSITPNRQGKNKADLYEVIAQLVRAMGSSHRLELLDLLIQAPRTVEQLAEASAMTVANTSQHLQRLKHAGLVEDERHGTSVLYRVANPAIAQIWVKLQVLAEQQLPELERALNRYRPRRSDFPQVTADELKQHLKMNRVVLLDVRPRVEYDAGHLPEAVSIPLAELPERVEELPKKRLIVTYCRGPLCVYADQALDIIVKSGRRGARLEEGVAEWRLAGYPLA